MLKEENDMSPVTFGRLTSNVKPDIVRALDRQTR